MFLAALSWKYMYPDRTYVTWTFMWPFFSNVNLLFCQNYLSGLSIPLNLQNSGTAHSQQVRCLFFFTGSHGFTAFHVVANECNNARLSRHFSQAQRSPFSKLVNASGNWTETYLRARCVGWKDNCRLVTRLTWWETHCMINLSWPITTHMYCSGAFPNAEEQERSLISVVSELGHLHWYFHYQRRNNTWRFSQIMVSCQIRHLIEVKFFFLSYLRTGVISQKSVSL